MPTLRSIRMIQTLACAALLGTSLWTHAHDNDGSVQAQESLLSWSALDFATYGPKPEKVRNVHMRYVENDRGERIYTLCGQFLPAAGTVKSMWTHFVTIKTDPYEQWIGGNAEAYCERAIPVSANASDLSDSLEERLNNRVVPDEAAPNLK